VIPQAEIIAWRTQAPWKTAAQVEQDLIICRALVELFSQETLRQQLVFRGGTALYKLHLRPAVRYSEDIDLVQIEPGPNQPIKKYLAAVGLRVSQREFRQNLAAKIEDPDFLSDIEDLLRQGLKYDHRQAHQYIEEHLISVL
jgi:hypothetical protein